MMYLDRWAVSSGMCNNKLHISSLCFMSFGFVVVLSCFLFDFAEIFAFDYKLCYCIHIWLNMSDPLPQYSMVEVG